MTFIKKYPEGERLTPDDWVGSDEIIRHFERYAFAGQFVASKNCLDIACGSGYGSNYLIKSGAKTVAGGDISPEGIKYARTHFSPNGLHFFLSDAQRLPFLDKSFDVVISIETIEHLKEPRQFVRECHRVLKPGGTLIFSTPNKGIYDHPEQTKPTPINPFCMSPYHLKEFFSDELVSLVEGEHFHDITVYGQSFINKNVYWRVKTLGLWFMRSIISILPNERTIADFLNRTIRRKKFSTLTKELNQNRFKNSPNNIMPLSRNASSGDPINIVLTARRE